MFDKLIQNLEPGIKFLPKTLGEIIFSPLPHRDENCTVIYSHIEDQFISVSLPTLRMVAAQIGEKLKSEGLKSGDTILLASFSSSNELANALIFTAATCMGIRVFIPMFPEPDELVKWKEQTGICCLIMPYQDTLFLKNHEREKNTIHELQATCRKNNILFLDAYHDFRITDLIRKADDRSSEIPSAQVNWDYISPKAEAVIFTTSGTSGISKLLVYTHEALINCCQAWQFDGLFHKDWFGNPGFSPLFTHTIGIRTFLNCICSGNPFCMILTDWFLTKPEIVRYLLLKMNPGHLIAGPAFYNTLLELFRQFPELKTGMKQALKAAISIGAPYDEATAAKFESAAGISLMNAFGTTETLMVLLNRPNLADKNSCRNLGKPLPGVAIGLKGTAEQSVFELAVHSEFQSIYTIDQQGETDFFETGDLVTFDSTTNEILYLRRKNADFIKDDYGVKIPLSALEQYYESLLRISIHIEWIPLENTPGLAALMFMPAADGENCQAEIAALIKNTNENLKLNIEPFEFSHRHIERFSLVYGAVPVTRKGTVSKNLIWKTYAQEIAELRNPFVFSSEIKTAESTGDNSLYKFSNPHLAGLLEALKLDKTYVSGDGDYLYFEHSDELQPVLDLVGGFGANLMGHNHRDLREAVIRFIESGRPSLNNQGSQYYYPAKLARELNLLFGRATGRFFKVQFANSGTEATELALHHAWFEWKAKFEKLRDLQFQLYGAVPGLNVAEVWNNNMQVLDEITPGVLTVNDCFHGYSSGARSLLKHKKRRDSFSGLLKIHPLNIADQSPDAKAQIEEYISRNVFNLKIIRRQGGEYFEDSTEFSAIIASIIEPVQGEGGIVEINPDVADYLSKLEFPLISDEIQCGLGRTGSLPSYNRASYYLLGKSLGGGFAKIAAVLIDDERFKPTFPKYYSSTFANGELAACVGLSTLQVIQSENLPEKAAVTGSRFRLLLIEIAAQYPEIIKSINGRGLMIGIHFNPEMAKENNFLRVMIENEMLGYLFAGWFLNEHAIRILPSLSNSNSLRIEPSFYIAEPDFLNFCSALTELCEICRSKRIYELCKFLMNGDPYPDRMAPDFTGLFPQQIEEPAKKALRVGFVANFTVPHRELQLIEPDFLKASDTGLRILFNRMHILLEGKPIKILSKNLLGDKVHFTFYILPFGTSQLEVVSRWGKKRFYISKIQEAVDKLTQEGSCCISLGAHASIVTGNGLNLAERDNCRILTGNTLTVASCIYYLDRYLEHSKNAGWKNQVIAIVGAAGNVGTGLVDCLNDKKYADHKIVLLGNNSKRMQILKAKLNLMNENIELTTELFELLKADVIVCCTNTNDPIIFKHHIQKNKPVFLIDISVPVAVSEEVKQMKNVYFCGEASSVYLPDNPEIMFSTHTPRGKTFCCAGEAILCALYDLQIPLKGHIQVGSVRKMIPLAVNEGFFKTTDNDYFI